MLRPIAPHQPEADKSPAWLVLDAAEQAERDAARQQTAVDSALTAAASAAASAARLATVVHSRVSVPTAM